MFIIILQLVKRMILSYKKAAASYGSSYQIDKEVAAGNLYRVARGFYSDTPHCDPYALASVRYPRAIITMDSAFYIHGLTDVIPDKVHLATLRNATRIADDGVVQYFSEKRLFEPGSTALQRDGAQLRIYSRERMLVELMRSASAMPLDYYREIIASYRRIVEGLDIRAVEDYMALFERNNFMFDILQREVL